MREVIYSVKKANWNKEPSYLMVNRDGSVDITDDIRLATSFLAADYDAIDYSNTIIEKMRKAHPERMTVTISVDPKVFPSNSNFWEHSGMTVDMVTIV